uniref:Uncharacterized protein n=1 Tax=Pithovirus LCPAC101 TaxID=2506586 RepID=A0A481Z1Z6_9VIRU|nr:MAG: hypothetical protein LCPAC101_00250 [Pithovirus LCPAC101]
MDFYVYYPAPLFNVCSSVLIENNVNLSKIGHLRYGKDIILKKFERNIKKTMDAHLYNVYDKYDLINSYSKKKEIERNNELNEVLHGFGIDISMLIRINYTNYIYFNDEFISYGYIKNKDFNDNFSFKSDVNINDSYVRLIYENHYYFSHKYDINNRGFHLQDETYEEYYISNNKIVHSTIFNIDMAYNMSYDRTKTIYFTLNSQNHIYKLDYMHTFNDCVSWLSLRYKYNRIVSCLLDM